MYIVHVPHTTWTCKLLHVHVPHYMYVYVPHTTCTCAYITCTLTTLCTTQHTTLHEHVLHVPVHYMYHTLHEHVPHYMNTCMCIMSSIVCMVLLYAWHNDKIPFVSVGVSHVVKTKVCPPNDCLVCPMDVLIVVWKLNQQVFPWITELHRKAIATLLI